MKGKTLLYAAAILALCICSEEAALAQKGKPSKAAQKDTLLVMDDFYTDEYLDTVKVNRKLKLNDYSMIGVHYGPSFTRAAFNPSKKQGWLFTPVNFGITYTTHAKMFGFMPYFGFEAGLFYGQDGYRFKPDPESGEIRENVDQARKAIYNVIQAPFQSYFHYEIWKVKLMLDAGFYLGYRLKVERTYDEGVSTDYVNSFYDYDRRFDYGLQAGAGFGILLDPIEIHVKGEFRYSLSSLYKPDYNSAYYYRFAYPMDVYISVGIHYQLGKRTGKTRSELKREAREAVFGPEQEKPAKEKKPLFGKNRKSKGDKATDSDAAGADTSAKGTQDSGTTPSENTKASQSVTAPETAPAVSDTAAAPIALPKEGIMEASDSTRVLAPLEVPNID